MQSETPGQLLARKAGMWLLMITIVLLFAGLTLVLLISTANEDRLHIPPLFFINTLFLVISSAFVHWSWTQVGDRTPMRLMIGMLAGGLFLIGQAIGWIQMVDQGFFINGDSRKVSFLYVLTGIHAAHLIGGLLYLWFVWFQEKKGNGRFLETAVYFWHFLGILWVYLLAVLSLNF
jgi:cytochrome c oxidase subunit 3